MRNKDQARSSESNIVRDSYAPWNVSELLENRADTLSNETSLELLQEFKGQLIFWRQSFFSNNCFHSGRISTNGIFCILNISETVNVAGVYQLIRNIAMIFS